MARRSDRSALHSRQKRYVGVAESHPYFERSYNEEALCELRVHGGLTFNGHCAENDKEHGICHVPAPGEPDNVWWLGFDCAHAFDLMPGTVAKLREVGLPESPWHLDDIYRTLDYVKAECASLAQQLARFSRHESLESAARERIEGKLS